LVSIGLISCYIGKSLRYAWRDKFGDESGVTFGEGIYDKGHAIVMDNYYLNVALFKASE
jgi:hypothetical protein